MATFTVYRCNVCDRVYQDRETDNSSPYKYTVLKGIAYTDKVLLSIIIVTYYAQLHRMPSSPFTVI